MYTKIKVKSRISDKPSLLDHYGFKKWTMYRLGWCDYGVCKFCLSMFYLTYKVMMITFCQNQFDTPFRLIYMYSRDRAREGLRLRIQKNDDMYN